MFPDFLKDNRNKAQRLVSVIVGILLAAVSSYMYMVRFFEKAYGEGVAVITELITGPSVFKDYYKPADFLIPRHFLISFLVFFALYYVMTVILMRYHESLSFGFYAILATVFLILFKKFFGYDMRMNLLLALALFALQIVDLCLRRYQKATYDAKAIDRMSALVFVGYFACRAFAQMLLNFGMFNEPQIKKGFCLMLILAYAALLCVFIFGGKIKKAPIELIYTEGAQGLLLCFLLSLFFFRINYNGNIETTTFMSVRILAVMLIVAIGAYLFIKRKEAIGKIHPHSLMIMAAMQLSADVPVDGFWPVNLFHFGELTVPFSELANFGNIPYFNFFPIHGICDYFFASINAALFDGTYGAFFYAYYIGSMILVALVAYVVYKCIDNPFYAAFIVTFFMTIGEWYYFFRFILVLPILLIFFSKKVKNDAYKSAIVYVVTSIISIAWYPAIGGSLAVALLIPTCIRVFRKSGREQLLFAIKKENRKAYLPSFIGTLLLGLSFVPMFFGIVRYLKENMGISGYFPGDRLYDLAVSSNGFSLFFASNPFYNVMLLIFAFIIAVMVIVGVATYYKKMYFVEVLIAVVAFLYMICSYTFGSIFAGERGAIVNVVLFLLLAFALFQDEVKRKVLPAILIALAFVYNTYDFNEAQATALVNQEISDQFVKVDGQTMGYPNMGTAYMPAQLQPEIADIAFVINELCPEGETYLDFTNQSAIYMMMKKETPFAYCALYHGTSDATREAMFAELKENLPKLVLVAPYWNNDGGSIALRYKDIYQYIWDKGYVPYQYGSVCFLLSDEVEAPEWAVDGSVTFFGAMTTTDLQGLPAVWGRSMDASKFAPVEFTEEIIQAHDIVADGNGNYTIDGADPYFQIVFSGEDISDEAEYLLVHFDSADLLPNEGTDMKLYFSYPDGAAMEEVAINCVAKNGDLLVPIYAYPMWDMFQMTTVRFDFEDEEMQGKTVSMSFELLKDKE